MRKSCEDWYLTYLDARIIEVWPSIAAKVIHGSRAGAATPDVRGKIYVYKILILIGQSLEADRDFTLTDIVAKLKGDNVIIEDAGELATQLVFQCLGWLTALFDPSPEPSTTRLSLRLAGSDSRRSANRKSIIRHPFVAIAAASSPIQRLLRKFGSLLPEPECVRRSDAAGGLEAGAEDITATYVYYNNLRLLNVRIKWVDVLNQHLEFDRRNRILRIFRTPSICRLMYRDKEGTLLDLVCHEVKGEYEERSSSPQLQPAEIEAFLSEVLLSYRLIFGCQPRSRVLIGRELEMVKGEWRGEGRCDPLLEILCTKNKDSREMKEVYKDLDAKDFEDYVSVDEFPFLARRIFDLQRFSMAQHPHSWKRLWYDQRNKTSWFTTWAVVVLGGGTLLIQMLQLVFQIYQPFSGGGGSH